MIACVAWPSGSPRPILLAEERSATLARPLNVFAFVMQSNLKQLRD